VQAAVQGLPGVGRADPASCPARARSARRRGCAPGGRLAC